MNGKAGRQLRLIHLVERIQVGADDVVAMRGAANAGDGAILACSSQVGDQNVLNHVGGTLCPALIFVGAELNGARTEDETIIAVDGRSGDRGKQSAPRQ